MRFLFAIREPFLPEVIGGGVLDIHHLIDELTAQGHESEVVAWSGRRTIVTRYRAGRAAVGRWASRTDSTNGYPTTRAVSDRFVPRLLARRIDGFRPDVVVVQGSHQLSLAEVAASKGVPTILRLIMAESVENVFEGRTNGASGPLGPDGPLFISNSGFVAGRARERLGIDSEVLYPTIRLEPPDPAEREPRFVVFINPHPVKGVETVLEVAARLPHREFLLVESWPLADGDLADLSRRLRSLPNVSLRRHSDDMSAVYGQAAALMVPSRWEEAFGRVVVEANAHGVPVVASKIGGIPEAMGGGGVLLDPADPPARWAEALEEVLSDDELHGRLSALALENAGRPDLNPAHIARRFAAIAAELAQGAPAA